MIYRTKDGDVLDAICRSHYGADAFSLAVVLEENPGLAARGAVMPSGVLITLPEHEVPQADAETIRLWE